MRWMVRGDVDGFFGLALDNLVQFLSDRRPLPGRARVPGRAGLRPHPARRGGVAARRQPLLRAGRRMRLAARHRADRRLRAALRHQHGVALRLRVPGHAAGEARWPRRPAQPDPGARRLAGGAGRLLRLGRHRARRRLRRRAGAAGRRRGRRCCRRSPASRSRFISLGFLFRTFARPVVGLTTLAIVLLTYFGRVRFKGGLPGGLVAVALGTRRSPGSPGSRRSGRAPAARPGSTSRCRSSAICSAALGGGHLSPYLSVIVADGALQRRRLAPEHRVGRGRGRLLRDAAVAGGQRPRHVAAALFGSCFPTTIYIGHPGWKAHGRARRLFGPERRVRHAGLPDRHARLDRLGDPDRRRHGDRPLDRDRDHGAGVPGHAARARAGGGRRPAARRRRRGARCMAKNGLRAAGMGVPGGRRSARR